MSYSDSHRRCCNIYIYIIYTPNLGLEIAILGLEREHSRFRGSTEGAREAGGSRREQEGAGGSRREQEGAGGSTGGALGEHWGSTGGALGRSKRAEGGAVREERFWLLREPNLAAPYSATAATVIYPSSVAWLT
jgi:hypothetical protein